MIVQKIAHCTDSILTQEMARIGLEDYGVVVTWYTNQNNKQSVVHSHPYHEIVLPISGSNVLYAFQGSLYTLHPGEMVFFPAEIYHSGRYTVTDIVSNRLVVQISAEIWDYAIHASGLINPDWQKNIVILSADAVSALDLRGHLERMARIPWISRSITLSPPLRWRLSLKISSSAGSISPELSRNTLWKAFTDISTICECSTSAVILPPDTAYWMPVQTAALPAITVS